MRTPDPPLSDRRRFLAFLAGSPLLAAAGIAGGPIGRLLAASGGAPARVDGDALAQVGEAIARPEDAINVFDFEATAGEKLPPAHFGYMATGVDDDATLRANREGFSRFAIRVRRLVDIRKIDMSVSLFGTTWSSPIVLAPAGSQRAFHPEGELATARAARAKEHLQILSTVTTTSVEDVTAARGAPIWYQLYAGGEWRITQALVKRAEGAGCPVLVLTVDLQGGTNRETLRRAIRRDDRRCETCHKPGARLARKPMYDGIDLTGANLDDGYLDWDFVKRLRDATPMKLAIKGIVTREDAELAVEHGVDAVIVSNHGGRAEESGRSTIESLPEVVKGAAGRIPVLVDSGFRRGTDIFKALALGASAICIGRPYLWGLGSFGQTGVETVLDILRGELQRTMRQAGTVAVPQISEAYVVDRGGVLSLRGSHQ